MWRSCRGIECWFSLKTAIQLKQSFFFDEIFATGSGVADAPQSRGGMVASIQNSSGGQEMAEFRSINKLNILSLSQRVSRHVGLRSVFIEKV
jgi:hypothetical protein